MRTIILSSIAILLAACTVGSSGSYKIEHGEVCDESGQCWPTTSLYITPAPWAANPPLEPTVTPLPADTPVPENTPTLIPVDTDTPEPLPTDTPVPVDTDTPVPVDTPTITILPTDTSEPTVVPVTMIQGVVLSTDGLYLRSVLDVGAPLYINRDFFVTSAPLELLGHAYLLFSNVDRTNIDAGYLRFDLAQPADVYVAFVDSATVFPAWLDGWADAEMSLSTTDGLRRLFVKSFPAGEVVLGGNAASPVETSTFHYNVIVVPTDFAVTSGTISMGDTLDAYMAENAVITWSVLEGPGPVEFVDPHARDVELSATVPGRYRLQAFIYNQGVMSNYKFEVALDVLEPGGTPMPTVTPNVTPNPTPEFLGEVAVNEFGLRLDDPDLEWKMDLLRVALPKEFVTPEPAVSLIPSFPEKPSAPDSFLGRISESVKNAWWKWW